MREPRIDPGRRRVALDPRDPAFYNDPYPAYRAIREAAPIFFWEQYGFWCFARHADVSALLRDRRFGRHSLLELEPPEHSRLRNLVNRAFVSRQVERLAPRIAALTNDLIDGFK